MKLRFSKFLPLLVLLCTGTLWSNGQVTINGPAIVCKGQTATYTVTPVAPGYHYVWSVTAPGNLTGSPATPTVAIAWSGSGTGILKVVAVNLAGIRQDSNTLVVTSLPPPSPLILSSSRVACQQLAEPPVYGGEVPTPVNPGIIDDKDGCVKVCSGSTVTYSAANPLSSDYTWTVYGAASYSSSGGTCTVTWGAPGAGSVTLTETLTTAPCTGSRSVCVDIIEKPGAFFFWQPDPGAQSIAVCKDDNVIFTDQSQGSAGSPILSWYWDFGDGGTFAASNGAPVQHQFSNVGLHTVRLVVKNACSCTDTFEMQVEVLKNRGVEIECPSVVCEGTTATYNLLPAVHCSNYDWNVTGGSILSSSYGQPLLTVVWDQVDASGFGYVSFDATNCVVACPNKTTIKVPVIKAIGDINGPSKVCPNTQALFSLPEWPATIFKWTISSATGATLDSTDQNNQIVLNAKGPEMVTLTCNYTNTLLGCSGEATMQVQVTAPDSIAGPGVACLDGSASYRLFYSNAGDWVLTQPNGSQVALGSYVNSVSPSFPMIGTYVLSVSGPNFCAPPPVLIRVGPKPPMPDSISGESAVCANIPSGYSAGAPLPGTSFGWNIVGGTAGPLHGQNTTATFTLLPNPSKVQVWRVTDDVAHCTSDTLTKEVYRPVVTGFITGSSQPCPSTVYTYDAGYHAGETYLWTVSPNTMGSVQGNANDPTVKILWNGIAGPATIHLTITKCGQTYPYTKVISVIGISALSFSIPDTVCRDETVNVQVNNPGISPGSVIWKWGDISPNDVGNPASHVYTAASPGLFSYTISVKVPNAYGCLNTTLTGSKTIQVRPAPVVSVSPIGPLGVCPGDPFPPLTATLQSGFEATGTLEWRNDLGTLLNTCTPVTTACATYTPTALGKYHAVAIGATHGCKATSNEVEINSVGCGGSGGGPGCGISPAPVITLTPTSNCGLVTFTVATSGGGTRTSYNWYCADPSVSNVTQTATTWSGKFSTAGPKSVIYSATFVSGSVTCSKVKEGVVMVPLIPGMGQTITCNPAGLGYDVTLHDNSNYHPSHTPGQFKFELDGVAFSPSASPQYGPLTVPGGGAKHGVVETVTFPGGTCTITDSFLLPSLPVADFTWGPQPVACLTQTAVQFTNLSVGGVNTNWTFTPSVPNSAPDPFYTFQPTMPTAKTATLQVSDVYGCSSSKTYNIGVIAPNLNGEINTSGNNLCHGESVTLFYQNAGGSVTPDTFAWKNNTTSLYSTLVPNTRVYEPGGYWVRATNAAQCYRETSIVPVNFITPPPAIIRGDSATCLNEPFTLNGYAGSDVTYQWLVNGYALPGATGETYTNPALTAGLFIYKLVVGITQGGVNCYDTSLPFKMYVNPPPAAPTVTYNMLDCNTYSVMLTASSTVPVTSYNWSSGGASNVTVVQGGGPYRVYTTDANGCRSHGDTYVPKDPRTYLWIFPGGCYSYCASEMPKKLVGPYAWFNHWAWLQSGGPGTSGVNKVADYLVWNPGAYNLELDNGMCNAVSDTMKVDVAGCADCVDMVFSIVSANMVSCSTPANPQCCYYLLDLDIQNTGLVDMGVTVNANSGSMVPGGTLVPAGSGGTYTFQFLPGGGFSGGWVTITISYTSYDGEGTPTRHICTDQVYLNGCNGPQARMAMQGASTTLAEGGYEGSALVLVPNPATTKTRVDYKLAEASKEGSLELYDLMGRRVASQILTDKVGNWTVDLDSLPAGTYLVILKQSSGKTMQAKLVVTH